MNFDGWNRRVLNWQSVKKSQISEWQDRMGRYWLQQMQRYVLLFMIRWNSNKRTMTTLTVWVSYKERNARADLEHRFFAWRIKRTNIWLNNRNAMGKSRSTPISKMLHWASLFGEVSQIHKKDDCNAKMPSRTLKMSTLTIPAPLFSLHPAPLMDWKGQTEAVFQKRFDGDFWRRGRGWHVLKTSKHEELIDFSKGNCVGCQVVRVSDSERLNLVATRRKKRVKVQWEDLKRWWPGPYVALRNAFRSSHISDFKTWGF